MENQSMFDLKRPGVASLVKTTLGPAPIWVRTEGMTRSAILFGLAPDAGSHDAAEMPNGLNSSADVHRK